MPRPTLWRDPDGAHWLEAADAWIDRTSEPWTWIYPLVEAVQDQAAGRWAPAPDGREHQLAVHPTQAGYIQVSADPLAEPHVARLHQDLQQLLADYQQQTRHPYPAAGELHEAFEDVASLPEQLRKHGYAAAGQAAHSGYRRGRQARRRG